MMGENNTMIPPTNGCSSGAVEDILKGFGIERLDADAKNLLIYSIVNLKT